MVKNEQYSFCFNISAMQHLNTKKEEIRFFFHLPLLGFLSFHVDVSAQAQARFLNKTLESLIVFLTVFA